jgi:hypothetical protein
MECYEYVFVFGSIKMIVEEEVVAYFKAISRPSAGWADEN